ncbi:hypothetical protein, partial [Bacillus mycoides]|uniref:hypothetical protein n=1 Tax=Bacillus mycoides TaxID=1405 RepID=UPI001C931403
VMNDEKEVFMVIVSVEVGELDGNLLDCKGGVIVNLDREVWNLGKWVGDFGGIMYGKRMVWIFEGLW